MTYQMTLLESKAEGIEQGIEQGIEKGEEKKANAIAEKMILSGEPFEKIAEFTELSMKYIKALAKKIFVEKAEKNFD